MALEVAPGPRRIVFAPGAERGVVKVRNQKKVGERVVDAIRTRTFYAFVGAVPADVIRARHRRIEDALNSPWVTHY